MGFKFNKLKKLGSYTAFAKCPNCGFGSEIRIPKGISVPDFVKGGKCSCDKCAVVFYPEEYTTEDFEHEKVKASKVKVFPKLKNKNGDNFKWVN